MCWHTVSQRARHFFLLIFWPAMVIAAVVTNAQIIQAVQNSPYANQWLRDNASAVANLAIRVESGGETTRYNGSCCYGVLQLTTRNIRSFANMTPTEYQQASLQTQIDAWTQLTVAGLRGAAPQALAGMTTFDGRAVDGNLVLSCVQLGIGNCQTMLNSGRCSGFADSNGTTICSMANRMTGGAGNTGGGVGTGTGGSGNGGGPVTGGGSPVQTVGVGFQQGSGVTMGTLKTAIHAIAVAITLLIVGSALIGLWRQYAGGRITKPELILAGQKAGLIVVLIFIAITFV